MTRGHFGSCSLDPGSTFRHMTRGHVGGLIPGRDVVPSQTTLDRDARQMTPGRDARQMTLGRIASDSFDPGSPSCLLMRPRVVLSSV